MMKRALATLSVAVVSVIATAGTALADYPPTNVKGETVETVAPNQATAFTGSNTMVFVVAMVALLLIGAALLAWARSSELSRHGG